MKNILIVVCLTIYTGNYGQSSKDPVGEKKLKKIKNEIFFKTSLKSDFAFGENLKVDTKFKVFTNLNEIGYSRNVLTRNCYYLNFGLGLSRILVLNDRFRKHQPTDEFWTLDRLTFFYTGLKIQNSFRIFTFKNKSEVSVAVLTNLNMMCGAKHKYDYMYDGIDIIYYKTFLKNRNWKVFDAKFNPSLSLQLTYSFKKFFSLSLFAEQWQKVMAKSYKKDRVFWGQEPTKKSSYFGILIHFKF